MKLVVGLGNPGKKYENTRHNLGFIIIDKLASEYNASFKKKFQGEITSINIDGEKVLLLKPQTFMNLSGTSVKQSLDFYDLSTSDLLLIFDDLDMEFGKIKIKKDSSAGGHNGVKDIISKLKTQAIYRIKYGISSSKKENTKDFVLSSFTKSELEQINAQYEDIKNIILNFLKQ